MAPTRLTVAVNKQDNEETEVLVAYAHALDEQKKDIRFRIQKFNGYRETAEALERGTVDLALVRPDVLYPANGLHNLRPVEIQSWLR